KFQAVILIGLDDFTLVGAPEQFTRGSVQDLEQPDAVAIDEMGYRLLWPDDREYVVGKELELNDRRAVVQAIFKASQTYGTNPVIVTRISQAVQFVPPDRRMQPFVLARHEEGASAEEVARRIHDETGLQALTTEQFIAATQARYLWKSSTPMNLA